MYQADEAFQVLNLHAHKDSDSQAVSASLCPDAEWDESPCVITLLKAQDLISAYT